MSPHRDAHLGDGQSKAGQQTGKDMHREARRPPFANFFRGLESMPSNSPVTASSPYQHLRRVWRDRQTLCRMQLLSGVHLRVRTCVSQWREEPSRGGPQNPRGRNLILLTFFPKRGSRLARRSYVSHGAARSQISPTAWRTCPPTVPRSKVGHINIYDEFGASGKRFFVGSCCLGCICAPFFAYRCKRRNQTGGPQYPRGRNLIFDTCYPQRSGWPARTRKEGHCAGLPRLSSPGCGARLPTFTTNLAQSANAFANGVVVRPS